MQINPFGFPLGAGTQSASANGVASLGFADALGLAIEGGVAPQLIALKASANPPQNLAPKLAQTLAAQAQPMPATGLLPGLQQSTSLSELMATAAKLPGADPKPAAATTSVLVEPPVVATDTSSSPVAPAHALVLPTPQDEAAPLAPATEIATPPEAPLPIAPEPATPSKLSLEAGPAVPAQRDGELQPDGDGLSDAPVAAAPAQAGSSKPQKTVRGQAPAAEADPAPPVDANPAIPAGLLAMSATPQSITPQQSAPREASPNTPGGAALSKAGKAVTLAAPSQDTTQAAPGSDTTDFARAVAAKTGSGGSESSADGQPQAETVPAAAAKADAAPPLQHAHTTPSADPLRAAPAAASAEPVIEARAGHLGHSLGVEIARKVELGEETLRIRLNPVELGRIEVTLAFDDKGSLQATVRTESAKAMELLRQDAPDLARTLDQAGVRTDTQSFRFENRGGDSGGQHAQQQQAQNRGRFASSNDDAALAEPIYRPIRSDGQVDLLA